MKHIIVLCAFFLSFSVLAQDCAQINCADVSAQVAIRHAVGDAGIWSNIWESEGSIAYEARKLLQWAEKEFQRSSVPRDLCPAHCRPAASPSIMFSSIPQKYRTNYEEEGKCLQMLEDMTKSPLVYEPGRFEATENVFDWFNNFSRGKGDDGEDFYAKCGGTCSGRIHTRLDPIDDGWGMVTKVICGPARDKDQNKYDITVKIVWTCENR
jgi:hypothetical protein